MAGWNDEALGMRNGLFHGMRNSIDVGIIKRLMAGKLQDFATHPGHFGILVTGETFVGS